MDAIDKLINLGESGYVDFCNLNVNTRAELRNAFILALEEYGKGDFEEGVGAFVEERLDSKALVYYNEEHNRIEFGFVVKIDGSKAKQIILSYYIKKTYEVDTDHPEIIVKIRKTE